MRALVEDLHTPHPVARTLPGMYHGLTFVEGLCAALDEVIAPVLCTLDNLPAYLDVATAPEDLLPWLAAWTGMTLDPAQPPERQRALLRQAVALHGVQGTRRGIELAVEAVFGLRAEVQETGAVSWSVDADAPLPGEPLQAFVVNVFPADGRAVDEQRLDLVVSALKPAQVVHRVHVVEG